MMGLYLSKAFQIPVCKLIFFCFQRMLCVLMSKKFSGSVKRDMCFFSVASFELLRDLEEAWCSEDLTAVRSQ